VDNAKQFLNHVTKMVNSNWANNNVINANHAKLIKFSEETDVSSQSTAHATKLLTLLQIHAKHAQLVLSVLTMDHANQLQEIAILTTKSN